MDPLLPAAHFEPHRRRLTDLARWWLGSRAEAEDAVQDAYLRAGAAAARPRDSMEAWLVTVLRNLCIDRLRRRRLEQGEAVDASSLMHAPSAETTATLSLDAKAALKQLVRRLRADEVAVVLLHTVFDFDHAEIARWSGHEEATSRQRLRRAMQRLRRSEGGEAADREEADMLLGICWRAVQMRNPAALTALLARPAVSASALAPVVSGGDARGGELTRSKASLLQSGGHYAMSIELDGVVLCVVPVGLLDGQPDEVMSDACG
jgi:RNA polymerase sigma factor (sigma-70 family)